MLYHKNGYPAEDELVLCTVTSVQYNSVFCNLDEYPGKGGMIRISEVTAGRIRNIREFVQEGRKIVCKVLRLDQEKGHIDLSLRRVNERQRIEKNLALKQELKAENLLTHLAKELGEDPKAFYDKVAPAFLDHYEYIHMSFEDIIDEKFSLSTTKLDKKLAKRIEDLIRERIKPKKVSIECKLSVSTFAENGVQKVKDALIKARDAAQGSDIRYLGAGTYKLTVSAEEFKDAEKLVKSATDALEGAMKKVPLSTVTVERISSE